MKYYTIGEFSKLVGKSIPTLHLWDKKNKLKPHHVSEGGHRYYSEEQIYSVLKMNVTNAERRIIGYCRIPTGSKEEDLKNQIDTIKIYMISKGYSFEVISDIGNSIDLYKEGVNNLINLIIQGKVEKIVALNKDIISSWNFVFISDLCRKFNTTIEIIDKSVETDEGYILFDVEDMLSSYLKRIGTMKPDKAKQIVNNLLCEIRSANFCN